MTTTPNPTLTVKARVGRTIAEAARRAILLAREQAHEVTLTFNGIDVYVSPYSHAPDIEAIYWLEARVRNLMQEAGL